MSANQTFVHVTKLVDTIARQQFVRTDTRTETKRIGPMSGDGHSFDDQFEFETVTESVDVYKPSHSWFNRFYATAQLKKIARRTSDPTIKALCRQGIEHQYAESILRGVMGRVLYCLALMLSFAGTLGVIILGAVNENNVKTSYSPAIGFVLVFAAILLIFALWYGLAIWGSLLHRHGK